MRISLVVTTYNWPEALQVVMDSIANQSILPHEVIIADDGSKQATKDLIESYAQHFPCELKHSWQEDLGFRAASSRNKAIALSTGEYVIMIDGDIFLPKDFIKQHADSARKGCFVQGGRVILNKTNSDLLLDTGTLPNFFTAGIKNRKNMLESKMLSRMFSKIRNTDKSTRSCNLAVWREDILKVNGYNEDFQGWGREDSEFVIRLLNSGLDRIYLKFQAVGYHIFHEENDREMLEKKRSNISRRKEQKSKILLEWY